MNIESHTPSGPAWRAGSQEGPVLLAAKPLNGRNAPLAVARWLARREDRDLEVVAVMHQRETLALAGAMTAIPAPYFDDERRDMSARMQAELAPEAEDGARLHVAVLDGPTARTVVDAARGHAARVIVIGTGGHDAVGRHIFGERALEILDIADRPVLVVPADASAGPVATAVVAVDFSVSCLRAARSVVPMLSRGSRMHLVHVRKHDRGAADLAAWPDSAAATRCADQFRTFLRQLPSMPGVSVETHTLWGDPAQSIVGYASHLGAGLIACGRLNHSFIERLFVRSVSSDVVRRAACPVLVVPEITAA